MTKKRIAVIDLGTNTFHLLITEASDNEINTIYSEKVPVRIGKDGINQGFIAPDAYDRALSTMKLFREKTRLYHTDRIYATATSAFRNSRNGQELAQKIYDETGITITIISGDREAELIYFGVKEAIDLGEEKNLIVDIGGGSVEFILANKHSIFSKKSFEIGGQRLLEMFQKNDPISPEEIEGLNRYLTEQLRPLTDLMQTHHVTTLVGSSGSFDTLSDIDLQRKGGSGSVESRKEYELPIQDFETIYASLVEKDREARMLIPGMIELRVDMIVVAVVLIRFILQEYKIEKLRVSTYALKEGVVSRVLKGEPIGQA
jgi:exopolyphosphatase/guanosine-5'-triphosphate,3'-diphosphate pyrophosphatase